MNVKKMFAILLATTSVMATSIPAFAAVDPKISAIGNPPNEVFAKDLPFLPMSDPQNTRDWKFSLTLSDEFNADTLDFNKWDNFNSNWAGREPSYFQKDGVRVEDGKVVLRSGMADIVNGEQRYDAATIRSKNWTGYGYYEARTRTSQISMTSSFWFRGNGFEIDVYEQVGRAKNNGKPTVYPSNMHEYGGADKFSYPFEYETNQDLTLDYHVYGLEYGPDFIKLYFDGDLIRIMEPRDNTFNVNFPIIFDTETFHWKGFPESEDFYTYTDPISGEKRYTGDFHIDYIRVWKTDTPQTVEKIKESVPTYKTTHAIYGTPTSVDDALWNNAIAIEASNITTGGIEKFYSSMTVKTMWDKNFLYVLVDVQDSDQFINPQTIHDGDNVDLYFDFGNEKTKDHYDSNDFSIKILPDGQTAYHKNAPNVETNTIRTSTDYKSIVKIPWGELNATAGTVIGFDAQLNEGNTQDKKRMGIAFWNSSEGDVYKTMYTAGNLQLVQTAADIAFMPKPAGTNWFEDGHFNDPTNTQLEKWTITSPGEFSHEVITEDDGNNVLKISSTTNGNQQLTLSGLLPNTEYTLSFSAKKETATNKVCSVSLLHYTQDLINHEKANQGIYKQIKENWADYQITFTTDADTTTAKIMIAHNEEASTFIDNLKLIH